MKITYADAVIPVAAAVATALPTSSLRPMLTVGSIAAGKMAVDHLRREEHENTFVGIRIEKGDIPGLEGQPLDVVNAALNGIILGGMWYLPTVVLRKLPPLVAPAASGLGMLAVRLIAHQTNQRRVDSLIDIKPDGVQVNHPEA